MGRPQAVRVINTVQPPQPYLLEVHGGRVLKRMLIRSKLTALPPRLSPPTKGKGRSTAQHVDRRRHEQRRTSVVQERTIEFDKRLSNTLKYTNENTLDEIEYLRLFKSAVHAL